MATPRRRRNGPPRRKALARLAPPRSYDDSTYLTTPSHRRVPFSRVWFGRLGPG